MVFLRSEFVCFWTMIRIKLQDFITNTDTENKAMSAKKREENPRQIGRENFWFLRKHRSEENIIKVA